MNTHKKAVPEATGTAYEVTEGKQAIDNKSHTSTSTKARLAAIVANPIYQALAFLLVILIADDAHDYRHKRIGLYVLLGGATV